MYCPECKQQFEGRTDCPTHGGTLVNELPFQTVAGPTTTWVEITSVGTEEEARLVQGFLEAEEIPCQIENLRSEPMPANFGSMGDIRIYVSAESEKTALDLLASRQREYATMSADGDTVITDEGPAAVDDMAETVPESEES